MEYSRILRIWLMTGLVMLFVQVIVGGITRLTGSGLSITKWEIVTGTLPPLSEKDWEEAFTLYKQTPQYNEINEGMQMGSITEVGTFKFIYFWEYIHRFWARIMGFVFLIPFIFFWFTDQLNTMLKKRLIIVFLLAGLAASFGWIMVASGLIERPWVNAYKLALHLSIAFLVYAYLWWTYLKTGNTSGVHDPILHRTALTFTILLSVQIFLGGIMSGMKAAVFYPTWPVMNGEWIPQILFNISEWNVENFNNYDQNMFVPALIQFLHRGMAYAVLLCGLMLFYRAVKHRQTDKWRLGIYVLISLLIIQVLLGIITVVNSSGQIPVVWGVLHQAFALLLLTAALYLNFRFRKPSQV